MGINPNQEQLLEILCLFPSGVVTEIAVKGSILGYVRLGLTPAKLASVNWFLRTLAFTTAQKQVTCFSLCVGLVKGVTERGCVTSCQVCYFLKKPFSLLKTPLFLFLSAAACFSSLVAVGASQDSSG